jgi:hypothetical protein
MEIKEFTVKDNEAFRLRVKQWRAINPADLYAVEFIQETKDKKGDVDMSSTYSFYMSESELESLASGLYSLIGK